MMKPDPKRLANVNEACRYGGFARDKLYRLIHEGKIDRYKDGRRTYIDLDTIDHYKQSLPKG